MVGGRQDGTDEAPDEEVIAGRYEDRGDYDERAGSGVRGL